VADLFISVSLFEIYERHIALGYGLETCQRDMIQQDAIKAVVFVLFGGSHYVIEKIVI